MCFIVEKPSFYLCYWLGPAPLKRMDFVAAAVAAEADQIHQTDFERTRFVAIVARP